MVEETLRRVKNAYYVIPKGISKEAKHLLSRLLAKNPKDRISIHEILEHSFFVKDVLKPLITTRLRPMTQNTKYGRVQIFVDGSVNIDFHEKTMTVQSDGQNVNIGSRTFNLTELPSDYIKRYKFLQMFIELLRSKTPRVTIVEDGIKCHLMENTQIFVICIAGKVYRKNGDNWEEKESKFVKTDLDFGTREIAERYFEKALKLCEDVDWSNRTKGIVKSDENNSSFNPSSVTIDSRFTMKTEIQKLNLSQTSFIKNVGWCLKHGRNFLMLFNDGVEIELEKSTNSVKYKTEYGSSRYTLDSLPDHVRMKLCYFPQFVAGLTHVSK